MPLKNITTDFEDSLLSGSGELRVSNSTQLFEDRHNYNEGPVLWETVESVNGTVSHLPAESGVSLAIGAASGDKLVRQTYQHFNYIPGEGMKFEEGVVFPAAKTGLRVRAGGFTDNDGIFIEQDGSTLRMVRRSSTSGSAVDDSKDQSSWNIDKLDGTGKSGLILDMSKVQMLFIQYGWYGSGTVEVGFRIDGQRVLAHRFPTANSLGRPWARTGNLPLRYEIENTGATSGASALKTYGASVVTQGALPERGFLFSSEGVVSAADGVRTHLLSVRPKTTFNGITNRAQWTLESVDILVTGVNPVKWEIGFGHTLTGASWTDANSTYSASEYDEDGTINGQPTIVTESGFTPASRNSDTNLRVRSENILPLTLDAAGNNRDLGTIGLFVTGIGGSSDCRGIFNWREVI